MDAYKLVVLSSVGIEYWSACFNDLDSLKNIDLVDYYTIDY